MICILSRKKILPFRSRLRQTRQSAIPSFQRNDLQCLSISFGLYSGFQAHGNSSTLRLRAQHGQAVVQSSASEFSLVVCSERAEVRTLASLRHYKRAEAPHLASL